MPVLDLRTGLKELYSPPAGGPVIVDVPPMNFLMLDGVGDPRTAQEYQDAVQALYSLAYALKFKLKKEDASLDYTVMPLEGLWWVDDLAMLDFEERSNWKWIMMIALPDFVTAQQVSETIAELARKKPLPSLRKIRLERYDEGRAAQIMHIGPYSAEWPTVEGLHDFVRDQGLNLRGKHHEIYLGDPRRSAPEKLKTILRHPVE